MVEEQNQEGMADGSTAERAATDLREMLRGVDREIASLDVVRRMLLTAAIRQQSGMNIEDWLQAAEGLETLMQALAQPGQIGDADRRRRIVKMLSGWKGKLERLAQCFQAAADLAGNYVKDPASLAGSLDVLAQRKLIINNLIAGIEQVERE